MQPRGTRLSNRLRKTRESALPTRSSPKQCDAFATWLGSYRERLEEICKGAEASKIGSKEGKGKI